MFECVPLFVSFLNNELVPSYPTKGTHTLFKYCYGRKGFNRSSVLQYFAILLFSIHLWTWLFYLWVVGAFDCWLLSILNLSSQPTGL